MLCPEPIHSESFHVTLCFIIVFSGIKSRIIFSETIGDSGAVEKGKSGSIIAEEFLEKIIQ
jgi:hypothetical protein